MKMSVAIAAWTTPATLGSSAAGVFLGFRVGRWGSHEGNSALRQKSPSSPKPWTSAPQPMAAIQRSLTLLSWVLYGL